MINVRKSFERGNTIRPWLNSYHSFSFGNYYDPHFINFGPLRVINDDTVQPDTGFNKHHHQEMEIISYVAQGTLTHQDSLGNALVIVPGDIQIMSAGSGIEHSEFNHSKTEILHLIQIWITPRKESLSPRYDQKKIPPVLNKLVLIVSPIPQQNAVLIHQDAELYCAHVTANFVTEYHLSPDHLGWLQIIKGAIQINGINLSTGDGCAISQEECIKITCLKDAEFLFFDLED